MHGSLVRRLSITAVGAWLALSVGSIASGGNGAFSFTVDPTSGPPGTSVTVTAHDCGDLDNQLVADAAPGGLSTHQPDTGQLIVYVAGWGEPFESGFEGGTNDEFGVATATFQVPNVAPAEYVIQAECVPVVCPTAAAAVCTTPPLRGAAFGSYPPGAFTVTAPATTPAVPTQAVEAQATTAG